ncbi:hypothetical protein GCM10009835_40560 [Planosporangium flavigriseum]|uniref:Uncharacterized protein n=1 Tax=Planosporangium flavigriseum TaxID=373681 RepID=A0A8J3PL24_9ACTN|nr:hypothetical protein Pfl04_11730 [Planosporangium flavigriseum]
MPAGSTGVPWASDAVGTIYLSEAFAEYARAQVGYAEARLAEHYLDGCGLCCCGRVHPCDERRHWQQMKGHYLRCLDSLPGVNDNRQF